MKKLLVCLLALALLLPMALALPAKAEVAKEPFYALGWSDFDEENYPHLDGLVTSSFSVVDKTTAKLSYAKKSITYGSYTDEEVTAVATALKEELSHRPEGLRYWQPWAPGRVMRMDPQNAIFLDTGVNQLQDLFTAVINKLKEMNCPLDGIVLDVEYIGLGSWYLYSGGSNQPNNYQDNPNVYAEITEDPRYKTEIRPLLEERGFPFWPNPSGLTSEIYSICNTNKGAQYDLARSIWDTVMRIHLNNYANKWCYEPLKKAYPEVSLSDYQSTDSLAWLKLYEANTNGIAQTGGNSQKVGTASCHSYYYSRPGTSFYEEHNQYASYNDAIYEASAFNTLLANINSTRHMFSSTDTKQFAPWITSYVYGGKKEASLAYTPYYTELLYHLGMFDPEPFLSYTYVNEYADNKEKGNYQSKKYLSTQKVMNEIMAELTHVAGYSDRKPIEMPVYWNAEYVVSGMYANGRNLWRVTPNTDEISLEAFKTEGKDPTFSVKGQTISFPGGKILEEATISEVGSCGYWVETAKDVTPVMTSDADRYVKYPAFLENFDAYENGKLTPDKMAQPYAWGIRTQDSDTAEVVTSGTGKALALTGNASFDNITIPTKITAGDSYAEEQTWQISFTVPKGLSPEAEIYLLKYAGKGTKLFDNGIRIQDGKVYYSQVVDDIMMEEKELTSIKPGTYTLKRVMNFSDADYFTYDVYLLNSKGKEIARVENVPCPTFSSITSVLFFTKNADQAVLFDDYTLYTSGLTTDFKLFDATTGRNVDDVENPRQSGMAYRLSWMNATDTEKKLDVVAAIYEGDTLKEEKTVKTITMKPGCDAIDTGVVEIADGQSVKVYLKGDVQSFENNTTPGEPETASDVNIVLILAIAAAALLVVIVILTVSKKKKKAAAAVVEEETAEEAEKETEEPADIDEAEYLNDDTDA